MYGKTRINAAGLSTFEPEPCCWGYIHWYVNHLVADVEFFTHCRFVSLHGAVWWAWRRATQLLGLAWLPTLPIFAEASRF